MFYGCFLPIARLLSVCRVPDASVYQTAVGISEVVAILLRPRSRDSAQQLRIVNDFVLLEDDEKPCSKRKRTFACE